MSSFAIYIIGFLILIVGLALAASMLGVSSTWIGIGVLVLTGIAVMGGVSKTKRQDPPGTV